MKKEVGGFNLPDGIVLGPMYFSKNGKQSSTIIGPPIIAFNYGISNAMNHLNQYSTLEKVEFQTEFNYLLEHIIGDILVYFQNRLKLIAKTSNVGQMNSVDACVASYKKYAIEIEKFMDINLLTQIDRVRGRKHHTDRRYDTDYTINGEEYNDIGKLVELTKKVQIEVQNFDKKLSDKYKDYEVRVEKTSTSTSIEFTAIGHAFDFTRGGKIVPKKSKNAE